LVNGRLLPAVLPDARPLAGVKLRDLTPRLCRSFLASLTHLSQSERHKTGRTLRMVCHAAADAGLVPRSPMSQVKVPAPPRPDTHALTPDELAAVVAAADARGGCWPAFFRLAADAGLRPQEMAALALADFDPAAGTVTIRRAVCRTTNEVKDTKTDAGRRTIPLAPPTLAALREWLAARPRGRGEFLFPPKLGGHWRLRNLDRWGYAPVIAAGGVRMTPYTLRHTMATLLLNAGVSLKVVAARLGHASPALTLKTYAHVLPGDQERAAGVMGGLIPAPHALPTPARTHPCE
jgi:integrase